MNKIMTASAIALLTGLATPLAISTAAIAQETLIEVVFADPLAEELGLEDGEIVELPLSLAAEVCDVEEADLVLAPACDAVVSTEELEEFLEDEGHGDENSAKAFAPGQLKEDGESAREFAPGQVKEEGKSARESAPGQEKKSDD